MAVSEVQKVRWHDEYPESTEGKLSNEPKYFPRTNMTKPPVKEEFAKEGIC